VFTNVINITLTETSFRSIITVVNPKRDLDQVIRTATHTPRVGRCVAFLFGVFTLTLIAMPTSEMFTPPAAYAGGEISGSQVPGPGRQNVDEYFMMRRAAEVAKHDLTPEQVETLYRESDAWFQENTPDVLEPGKPEDYSTYDRAKVTHRLVGLAKHLRGTHPELFTGYEVDSTEAFVDAAFGMWEAKDDPDSEKKLNGSFAFVVPPRVSRANPEYGDELQDLLHVVRGVRPELRAAMLRNVPPWIVDYYAKDELGNQGVLLCVNANGDMKQDLSAGEALMASRKMVNDGVDLAKEGFGAWAIGYGATFPGVMKFGEKTNRTDVVTTTGHAGTIVEIVKAIEARHPDPSTLRSLGMIGLGAIGGPGIQVLADLYPNAAVHIADANQNHVARTMEARPGRFIPGTNQEVIKESDVVVSAVTTAIGLRELGLTKQDVKGTVFVDDSQPGSLNPSEVEGMGGVVLWPIGTDKKGRVVRDYCGYGDLMVNKTTDLFGCEAEVASLVALYNELYTTAGYTHAQAVEEARKQAIRGPVTVEQVHQTAKRFDRYGIGASVPQSFGVARRLPALPRPHTPHGPTLTPAPHAA